MSKPRKPTAKKTTKGSTRASRARAAPAGPARSAGAIEKSAGGKSPARLAEAEALLAEIDRRKARISEDFYDIGERLRDLLQKKLYVALGFATFAEMLKAKKVMGVTQAYKLIQLVSSVPREKALAVGSEKAFLLVDYAKATPEPDTPEWLLEQGKLPGGKRVADASTREIVAATKAARAKHTAKPKSADQIEADEAARALQASFRKRGAKSATATAVKKGSEWWVRVELKVAHAPALK